MTAATQRALAAHLGVSDRRIRELVREGVIPRGADIDSGRMTYLEHLREQAAGRGGEPGPGTPNLVDERALLARAQRERIELDMARAKRALIPVEEVHADTPTTASW